MGQARTTLALVASVALFYCLNTWRDPLRFVASGGVGLGALSLALSREPSTRLLFGCTAFTLLGLYAWAGTETVHLDLALNGNHLAARAGEMTLEADMPSAGAGVVGVSILPNGPSADSGQAGWIGRLESRLRPMLSRNLASSVANLRIEGADGEQLASLPTLWEPERANDPPLVASGLDLATNGAALLTGERPWRDGRVGLDIRSGNGPITILLRIDSAGNGWAVRATPSRQEMSLNQVKDGIVQGAMTDWFQRFRRPPLAGLQTLLREVLRAWLVGMALLAAGVLARPLARLVLGPADWLAPDWAGPFFVGLLGLAGLLTTAWVASELEERLPHVQDSVAYLFQAKTFALGRLEVPEPAVPAAFEHEFILLRDGEWFSKYPPGFPSILMIGVLLGAPWLVSPMLAGATLVLLYLLGRTLYSGATGLLATVLLVVSPFFILMSGSMMAHPSGLFLTTLGLLLMVRSAERERGWEAFGAGLSFGWLVATRQFSGAAILAPAVVWLTVRRLQRGRSLGTVGLVAWGCAWPVLGLLAYNRALTRNPFLNPFELWWDFDRIGFGPSVGMHAGHDLGRGLFNTYTNLSLLQTDLFGWPIYVTLAFALVPFVTGRTRAGDWLLAGVSLSLIGAFVAYWADGVMYGPRYYYEAIGCLALLTARGVIAAAETAAGSPRSVMRRRAPPDAAPFFVVVVAVLIGGNLLVNLPRRIAEHRGYNYVDGSKLALVREAGLRRALVLVPTSDRGAWWDYGSVFSANDPLLEGDVIYGRDLGVARNRATLEAFPDRAAYLLTNGQLNRLDAQGGPTNGR